MIAYGFGLSQQSRDTLKALSDLRKASIDEASKISDVTRGLASAVMASNAGNFTLVIARLTINKNSNNITYSGILFGIALAIYVFVVIFSGHNFIAIQKKFRSQWRSKIYRFLSDKDYEEMINVPLKKAESGFYKVAISGIVISLLTITSLIIVFLRN